MNIIETGGFKKNDSKLSLTGHSLAQDKPGFRLEFPMQEAIRDYLGWTERWESRY